jgi:hypothetical protein
VAGGLELESVADLFANASYVSKVEVAIRLAGCADANKGQIGVQDRLLRILRSAQTPIINGRGEDLPDLRLDDGSLAAIDKINFGRDGIDADHLMAAMGQASGRNRPNISQAKYANFQGSPLLSYFNIQHWSIPAYNDQCRDGRLRRLLLGQAEL